MGKEDGHFFLFLGRQRSLAENAAGITSSQATRGKVISKRRKEKSDVFVCVGSTKKTIHETRKKDDDEGV